MPTSRQIGIAAAGATLILALATRTRQVQRWDDAIERRMRRRRTGVQYQYLARCATLPGARFGHPAIGAAVAFWILRARPATRAAGARQILIPLAAASLGAIAAHYGIKLFYRRPRPHLARRRGKHEPAFPSGHTTDATAALATSAYLLIREDIAPPFIVIPGAAILALGTGWSRVALGWHWASDVAGGWSTGIAVAAGCATLHQWLAPQPWSNV